MVSSVVAALRRTLLITGRQSNRFSAAQKGKQHEGKETFSSSSSISIFTLMWSLFACAGGVAFTLSDSTSNAHEQRENHAKKYKYVICGAGVAAQEALKTLQEFDEKSSILVVAPDWRSPRTSRKLAENINFDLSSNASSDNLLIETNNMPLEYSLLQSVLSSFVPRAASRKGLQGGHDILLGHRVVKVDVESQEVVLDNGDKISFEKCLIAVGNQLPALPIDRLIAKNAISLCSGATSQEDDRAIATILGQGATDKIENRGHCHFTVVGGGWLALTAGAELVARGADVTFSYSEPSFMARYFPKYISDELRTRLQWRSDNGVDFLAYSALQYIIGRTPHYSSFPNARLEAEVHTSVIFDAFSFVDFRTDHVVFAPTMPPISPVESTALEIEKGTLMANRELLVASNVYAAGSCVSVGKPPEGSLRNLHWSENYARATGRHAALNMAGKRAPFSHKPVLEVEVPGLSLRLRGIGAVDGSSETLGYFVCTRERSEVTCGGSIAAGALFYLKQDAPEFRGASSRFSVSGVLLWDGASCSTLDFDAAAVAAMNLIEKAGVERTVLEDELDKFCENSLGLHSNRPYIRESGSNVFPVSSASFNIDSSDSTGDDYSAITQSDSSEKETFERQDNGSKEAQCNDNDNDIFDEKAIPAQRVLWRRHRSARNVRISDEEMMWLEKGGSGAGPVTQRERLAEAYREVLRQSAARP